MAKNIDSSQSITVSLVGGHVQHWRVTTAISDEDHVRVDMQWKDQTGNVQQWDRLVARNEEGVSVDDPFDHVFMKGTLTWKVSHGVNVIRFDGRLEYQNAYSVDFRGNGLVVAIWKSE